MNRIFVTISRYFVALVFIMSGLIKINDPKGFAFKLEEYFSPAVFNMDWLAPFSLSISVFIVSFELLLGILLFFRIQTNRVLKNILWLLIGFGFLTFYSAYYNKVTDCGCFGDAIKLTPWQSFYKDMLLLVLTLRVYKYRRQIKPWCAKASKYTLVGSVFAIVMIATYSLTHIPLVDFRAYDLGANISEKMKVPDDAPKDIYEYTWTFEDANHKQYTIVNNGEYPETEDTYIDATTRLIKKGYEPPIHDFVLEKEDGTDDTQEILNKPKVLLIVCYDLTKSAEEGLSQIAETVSRAREQGYEIIVTTAASPEKVATVKQQYGLDINFYYTDMTTLKTIVRSNPGFVVLHQGVIVEKVHYSDVTNLRFPAD